MKKITFTFVIFALTCIGLSGQMPTPQKPKQILFDFRLDQAAHSPKISLATQKTVLSRLFRKYLTDASKCKADFETGGVEDPLKAARNAGQIVPSIVDSATGSFTTAGQSQTAYVISVGECNASHADNFGTKRVAIFTGQQLVLDVDVDFLSEIVRKTDLDGDGTNELLMASYYMNQGTLVEQASLLDFRNGKRVIEDFGTVTDDSCASGLPGSGAKASIILLGPAGPGEMPKLRMENYRSACRKPKRWRFLSNGKMPD
jgi:hypothetical protein